MGKNYVYIGEGMSKGHLRHARLHSSLCTKLIPKILHSAQMIFNGNALTIKVGYVIMLLDEKSKKYYKGVVL